MLFGAEKAQIDTLTTQLAAQALLISGLQATTPQFVSATRMHWVDVVATYPADATLRGKYALVDDLYGALDGVLRCGFDGTRYFWQPSGLPEHFSSMSVAANSVLTALGTPTIINLSGVVPTLTTRTVTLSTQNVWPGARKRLITKGITSLLGTLQLLGLDATLNLVLGTTYEVGLDYSGGSPQWVRL